MLEILISLTVVFGGGETSTTLDVNPTFVVDAPIGSWFPRPSDDAWYAAFTLPHLVLIDSGGLEGRTEYERVLREELIHAEQWSALGPWYPVAYVFTLGEPFEPYSPRTFWRTGQHIAPDFQRMWRPGPELVRRCPLIRLSTQSGLEIMSCWRF